MNNNRFQHSQSNLSDLKEIIIETHTPKKTPSETTIDEVEITRIYKNRKEKEIQVEIDEVPIPIRDIAEFKRYYKNIKNAYNGDISYESITLDLIAIYLKGQKVLYVESKTFCEQCLYYLMLPAIFISAVCTVISVSLKNYLVLP